MAAPFGPLRRRIEARLDRLRTEGYLRDFRSWNDPASDRVLFEATLFYGEIRQYALTALEAMQSGPEIDEDWLIHVERDIIYRCDRIRQDNNWAIANQQHYQSAAMGQQCADFDLYQRQLSNFAMRAVSPERLAQQYQQINQAMEWPPPNEGAQKRAEELFLMICGKEAFDTLKSGKPLPVTGSQGTRYTLHKRASYCVERVSDNARLCAVVPGVPLWDHLLGIKLMIENDEPKFLETANVANGYLNAAIANTDQYGNRFLNQERYSGGFLAGLCFDGVLGNNLI